MMKGVGAYSGRLDFHVAVAETAVGGISGFGRDIWPVQSLVCSCGGFHLDQAFLPTDNW